MGETSPAGTRAQLWGELRPGEVVAEKYEITRVLGRGGLGVVYEAKHLLLGESVAIKFLRADLGSDPRIVARFTREARAAARIRSEHVARVLDVAIFEGTPFIVMEFLRGTDLMGAVKQRKRVPVDEACLYLLQACEAVAEAHALGVVHRDLKSANIFLTHRADGSACVKVLDFGISKLLGEVDGAVTTEDSSMMGSPAYMSPEQVRAAGEVDGQTDIWSLGVVLHELVTGKRPFNGEGPHQICMSVIHDDPPPASSVVPGIPARLDSIVATCLKKDRAERFRNVADLAAELVQLAPPEGRLSLDRARRILAGVRPPQSSDPDAAGTITAVPESSGVTVGGVDASVSRPNLARAGGRSKLRTALAVSIAAVVGGGLALAFFLAQGGSKTATPGAAAGDLVAETSKPASPSPAPSDVEVKAVTTTEPTVSPSVSAFSSAEAAESAVPKTEPRAARPSKPAPRDPASRPATAPAPGPKPLPEDRQ